MNTTIHLQYRDASNYKRQGTVTFAGAITDAERAAFVGALDQDTGEPGSMICEQVGIEGPGFDAVSEDDHCWTEVEDITVGDDGPDDDGDRTIAQFVAEVVAASAAGWDEVKYDPVRKLAEARGLL